MPEFAPCLNVQYDPEGDGKTKLDHVREMLSLLVHQRHLLFEKVLMDSWYATKPLMLHIEALGKTYYCPIGINLSVKLRLHQRFFIKS